MEVGDKSAVLMDSEYLKNKQFLSRDHFTSFLLDLIEEDYDVACTELLAHLRLRGNWLEQETDI